MDNARYSSTWMEQRKRVIHAELRLAQAIAALLEEQPLTTTDELLLALNTTMRTSILDNLETVGDDDEH